MQTHKIKVALLVAALVIAGAFAIWMTRRTSRHDPTSAPATPYDMICTSCGAESTLQISRWPPPMCPKCAKAALEIASICPRCGKVAPMKDSRSYWENPYGSLRSGRVLPQCAKCKTLMRPKIAWRLQQEELRRVGLAK